MDKTPLSAFAEVRPDSSIVASGVAAVVPAGAWPLEVRSLDSLGVLGSLWDELGLTDVVNGHVAVDEQVSVSPGVIMKALVLNIVGGRDPLYRVQQWASKIALDVVIGDGVEAGQLNDTTLGRHLDRLFAAGPESVFNAACLQVISHDDVKVDRMHADTTSRLVFGAYEGEDPDAISITYGHSKDKRPDLKQMMYGVTTSPDGIPIAGQVLSGNTSDKTWHGGMLDVVHQQLTTGKDLKRVIHYVGDSALVTKKNFAVAADKGITLTSRLPRTIGLTDTVVLRAVYKLALEDIGVFSDRKGATRYDGVMVDGCKVFDQPVQLGVYRPTPANKRTIGAVHRRRDKTLKIVRAAAAKLMKTVFFCEADAQRAMGDFEAEHLPAAHVDRLVAMKSDVVATTVQPKRARRGRPKAGSVLPEPVTEFRLLIEVAANHENLEGVIARESCFVLVHTGSKPITAAELMAAYKGQHVIESRFPFLKDPAWAEVFFLKTPHRLQALGYVLLFALLLWSIWERRVRANLSDSDEGPLIDTTGMKKKRPTAAVCRHILAGIKLMRMRQPAGAYSPWQLAEPLNREQLRVIRFSKKPPAAEKNAMLH